MPQRTQGRPRAIGKIAAVVYHLSQMSGITQKADVPMDDILAGLLAKFAAAQACWYSSVRPDGRTHLAPIWHVWHENAAYVVTQPGTVRSRNLAANPSVSLALPDPMNVLIIEGEAAEAGHALPDVRPIFQSKYNWDIATDAGYTVIICIAPTKLLAWGDHGQGRWRFDRQEGQWLTLAS